MLLLPWAPELQIKLRLLWDRAPETCHLMAELAEHPQANPECSFYRNEAVPEVCVHNYTPVAPYACLNVWRLYVKAQTCVRAELWVAQ